jgi:hypothetical protein
MVTNEARDEICKVGLVCCDLGIIKPSTLCSCAQQVLCFQSVASLPFHEDYISTPVCACYGIACLPECGCCAAPPVAPIFKKLRTSEGQAMERE